MIGLLVFLAGCGGGGGSKSTPTPPPPPPVDTTPNAFTFTSQSGTAISAPIASNEIVISGINASTTVTITGGEYSINGGAFTTAAGTVSDSQRIQVRVTGSAQFSTPVSAVLTVGGVSSTFTVTTLAADTVPDAFQFAGKTNGVRGAWVVSDGVTIAGINTVAFVSIDNGEYAVAGGAFTSALGPIAPGQSLVVRTRASSGYARSTRARVTVGTVTADFDVTSELPSYTPDAVAFDGQDVVYLLNGANGLIFRWSVGEARYLEPYTVGIEHAPAPTSMAYSSAHRRVYLGYSSGEIRYIDTAGAGAEVAFATMVSPVGHVSSAGNFLVVQGSSGYGVRYVLNGSGVTTGSSNYYYYTYSRDTAWDAATSRLYYTLDYYYPSGLNYDVIDQTTGQTTAPGGAVPWFALHPAAGAFVRERPIPLAGQRRYLPQSLADLDGLRGLAGDRRTLVCGWLDGHADDHEQRDDTAASRCDQSADSGARTYTGQAFRVVGRIREWPCWSSTAARCRSTPMFPTTTPMATGWRTRKMRLRWMPQPRSIQIEMDIRIPGIPAGPRPTAPRA